MVVGEALRKALKDSGHNQTWLADKMGYCGPSGISNIVWRNNLKVDTLIEICEILGYEATIQPKQKAGKRREGQIVLTGSEE